MKTLFKILGIVAITSMCAGFVYAHFNRPVEVVTVNEILFAGETVEGVAFKHYDHKYDNRSYAEFRDDVMKSNAHLFRNGRIPQIGDKVEIEVHITK